MNGVLRNESLCAQLTFLDNLAIEMHRKLSLDEGKTLLTVFKYLIK